MPAGAPHDYLTEERKESREIAKTNSHFACEGDDQVFALTL